MRFPWTCFANKRLMYSHVRGVSRTNNAQVHSDRKKIEAYCAKYGDSDSANVPDVVFWAGVYKAICEIKNAPEEKVQIARTWLKAHGFSASIS